jgi:hypothetical protein
VVPLNVELEREWSQFQEIVTCCEDLADRIGKSQSDWLTIAINAGIKVQLGKALNVKLFTHFLATARLSHRCL